MKGAILLLCLPPSHATIRMAQGADMGKIQCPKKRKNEVSAPLAHSTASQVEAFHEGGRKTGDRRRAERFLWM